MTLHALIEREICAKLTREKEGYSCFSWNRAICAIDMGSTTSAQPKEKEQSQTAPEKKGDHVESERFTEEEKASLNANKFVMLPCYPNPFADYGQNTRTVKADASVLSSGRSWESIVVLMERDLIDPGVLCAGIFTIF